MWTGKAGFRLARKRLGLTAVQVGELFRSIDVASGQRQLTRYDRGESQVPAAGRELLDGLTAEAQSAVEELAAELAQRPAGRLVVVTYRTDEGYASDGGTRPATWHQAIVVRAIDRLPVGRYQCRIEWKEDLQ